MYELHAAARHGSVELTVALLSRRGVIDIDEGGPNCTTPLIIAAGLGHLRVVRILLDKGANVSIAGDDDTTALHFAAQKGHLAVTKLLVKAGADLEAKDATTGSTPLFWAAMEYHWGVVGLLIEAGANPDSCGKGSDMTPLYSAAFTGNVAATRVLLRAEANPLLAYSGTLGHALLPLDAAAMEGHSDVVHELIREYGIEGCGGASGGVNALKFAAENQQLAVMGLLTSAGVVDTGSALIASAASGSESSVKFLLQQHERKVSGPGAGYPDTTGRFGKTPLVCSFQACRSCSPRITRLLVDAGADTTTALRLTHEGGGMFFFNDTLLALVDFQLRYKVVNGKDATESQLHTMEAIRRLLLRVEAVHAVSWLWARDASSITHAAAGEGTDGATTTTPTPLRSMLPVVRRRASRPRVLLAALFRNSTKP